MKLKRLSSMIEKTRTDAAKLWHLICVTRGGTQRMQVMIASTGHTTEEADLAKELEGRTGADSMTYAAAAVTGQGLVAARFALQNPDVEFRREKLE